MFDFGAVPGWEELTERQQQFCLAFLRSGNGSQAAREAGYSAKSSEAQASKLKANPLIRSCIAALREQAYSAESLSQAEAEAVLSRIARSRMGDCITPAGNLKLDQDRGGIASVSMSESAKGSSTSVKLRDPVAAITLLAKMKGWGEKDDVAAVQVGGVTFTFDFKRENNAD